MTLKEAQMEFIQAWGVAGSSWGIPRSMAQIHALLLSNKEGLSTEDVMDFIKLSRGNVNINLRELMNWGLVSKQNMIGERKEYFKADHEIWRMAKNIIEERKKREFLPVKNVVSRLRSEKIIGGKSEIDHFQNFLTELDEFMKQLDQLSNLLIKMNDNKFFKGMIKLMS